MRKHYRREDLGEGVRGKHYANFVRGPNLILLQPGVAAAFPTSAAVNSALERLTIEGAPPRRPRFSASYSSPMSGPTHRARCSGIFSNRS